MCLGRDKTAWSGPTCVAGTHAGLGPSPVAAPGAATTEAIEEFHCFSADQPKKFPCSGENSAVPTSSHGRDMRLGTGDPQPVRLEERPLSTREPIPRRRIIRTAISVGRGGVFGDQFRAKCGSDVRVACFTFDAKRTARVSMSPPDTLGTIR